jgi:Beta-galactosidase C-terminal domain
VEVTVRTSSEGTPLLYVLHHGEVTREIPLPPGTHRDLLTGRSLSGVVSLEPRQVLILETAGAGS